MKKNAVIINYSIGNFGSLIGTFENLNYNIKVSNHKKELENSDLIILPGVGTFPEAMENLKKLKLDKYLKKLSKKKKKNFGYLFRNAIINLFIERISFYKRS